MTQPWSNLHWLVNTFQLPLCAVSAYSSSIALELSPCRDKFVNQNRGKESPRKLGLPTAAESASHGRPSWYTLLLAPSWIDRINIRGLVESIRVSHGCWQLKSVSIPLKLGVLQPVMPVCQVQVQDIALRVFILPRWHSGDSHAKSLLPCIALPCST